MRLKPAGPALGSLLGLAAAAPTLVGTGTLSLAWTQQAGIITAIALALLAAIVTVWLIVRYIGRPIDEAVRRATRFGAGETHLRLDPDKGVPQFRALARVLNSIADQIADQDLQYDLVSKATGDAVWDWNAATGHTRWNGRLRALFGTAEDRFVASHSWWRERIHPEDRNRVEASLAGAVSAPGTHWSAEYRFRLENGGYRWFWDRGVMLRDDAGAVVRMIGCMTDISRQRASEERIWQLANHDELTGLPNRALFHSRLAALLAAQGAAGGARTGAILLIDLDDFKSVNDSLGHAAGDELLKSFGTRLQEAIGCEEIVFRLGGDEFAIALPDIADSNEVEAVADALQSRIREPFVVAGQVINIRATIGAVLIPQNGETALELMKNADIALYRGKAAGRNKLIFFDAEMRRATEERVALFAEVRSGIADDEFEPHYQPIVSLADGDIIGVEALMRWNHPDLGLRGPAQFMSVYEDSELALQLGRRLMQTVARDYSEWLDAGIAPPHVAVNVSAPGFRLPDLADRLIDRFRKAGIDPTRLVVEVTETVLLTQEPNYVEPNLRRLHAAGARIALDDFGTGYASLTHLQQFPVDLIKIDRSFVESLTSDNRSQAIVSTVLELGRRLDKTVIAEGVETLEQAVMLRAAGCSQAQGYLYARPMPADDFAALCATQQNQRRGVS